MFSKKIKITVLILKVKNKKIKRLISEIIQKKDNSYKVIETFSNNYKYSLDKKLLNLKSINQ